VETWPAVRNSGSLPSLQQIWKLNETDCEQHCWHGEPAVSGQRTRNVSVGESLSEDFCCLVGVERLQTAKKSLGSHLVGDRNDPSPSKPL
jgi:hypothetical protein